MITGVLCLPGKCTRFSCSRSLQHIPNSLIFKLCTYVPEALSYQNINFWTQRVGGGDVGRHPVAGVHFHPVMHKLMDGVTAGHCGMLRVRLVCPLPVAPYAIGYFSLKKRSLISSLSVCSRSSSVTHICAFR